MRPFEQPALGFRFGIVPFHDALGDKIPIV